MDRNQWTIFSQLSFQVAQGKQHNLDLKLESGSIFDSLWSLQSKIFLKQHCYQFTEEKTKAQGEGALHGDGWLEIQTKSLKSTLVRSHGTMFCCGVGKPKSRHACFVCKHQS